MPSNNPIDIVHLPEITVANNTDYLPVFNFSEGKNKKISIQNFGQSHSGYSGYSGISGYSGQIGDFGGAGPPGFSGFSGISGYSGLDGIASFSGYSGASGYSGFSGLSGISGYSGLSGYSGVIGLSGYSGFSGAGFSGYSGYSGLDGIASFSGYSGASGYSGLNGTSSNINIQNSQVAFGSVLSNSISGNSNFTYDGNTVLVSPGNISVNGLITGSILSTGSFASRTLSDRFSDIYNVRDFGAIGDGTSHPLSSAQATAFNSAYGIYGLSCSAGDETDRVAIQAALYKSANTGNEVYIPPGKFLIEKPLSQIATATPIPGQPSIPKTCKIRGAGIASQLLGVSISGGRGIIELLGTSNSFSINTEICDLWIEAQASCNVGSYGVRVGDAWCGWMMRRVQIRGACGVIVKISSSTSYAQICTKWEQVSIRTNYLNRWGTEDTTEVYCIQIETGGAQWDNIHFDSCIFNGCCLLRGHIVKFTSCQFYTQSQRPYGLLGSNRNIIVNIGRVNIDTCYFEDHARAIELIPTIAAIESVSITDSWFSGVQNFGGPYADYAIYCSSSSSGFGPITVSGCVFRSELYTTAAMGFYGVTAYEYNNGRIGVTYAGNHPSVDTNGSTRLISMTENTTGAYNGFVFTNLTQPTIPAMIGPLTVTQDTTTQATMTINNPASAGQSVASACLLSQCGASQAKWLCFPESHGSLPGQAWLFTSITGAAIVLGVGGTRRFQVNDVSCQASHHYNGTYTLQCWNNDTSVLSTSRIEALATTASIKLESYGSSHSTRPNQTWLYTAGTDMILGINSLERLRVKDNMILGSNNSNANFGLQTSNSSTGSSSYAYFESVSSNAGIRFASFSSGHSLSNQTWVYSFTDHPLILGQNGSESLRLPNDSSRAVLLRNVARVGGIIYHEVNGRNIKNFSGVSSMLNTGGLGTNILPANVLNVAGRGLRIIVSGYYASQGVDINFNFTLGGQVVVNGTKTVSSTSGAYKGFDLDFVLTTTNVGVSGSCVGQGKICFDGVSNNIVSITSASPIDTTNTLVCNLEEQMSVASNNNEIQITNLIIKME